ncbi:hypothetical protein [Enterococcus faecalis]|uniref:hypothetical protein n=1 Tax=Enterococcus faecalis TaxID=1351 RepID=UPI0018914491|nr:hypothetical protein [Enterococcus faecalis]
MFQKVFRKKAEYETEFNQLNFDFINAKKQNMEQMSKKLVELENMEKKFNKRIQTIRRK